MRALLGRISEGIVPGAGVIQVCRGIVDIPFPRSPRRLVQREAREGDGLRLRDYGDVVFVHLEALLDRNDEEVEATIQATLSRPVRVEWYS